MPVACCKNYNQCFSPDRNGILLCWGSAQKIKWIAGLLFLSRTIFSAPKKNTSLSTGACLYKIVRNTYSAIFSFENIFLNKLTIAKTIKPTKSPITNSLMIEGTCGNKWCRNSLL